MTKSFGPSARAWSAIAFGVAVFTAVLLAALSIGVYFVPTVVLAWSAVTRYRSPRRHQPRVSPA